MWNIVVGELPNCVIFRNKYARSIIYFMNIPFPPLMGCNLIVLYSSLLVVIIIPFMIQHCLVRVIK